MNAFLSRRARTRPRHAYTDGISTRKVDGLVKALWMTGIGKNRVSELCEEVDPEIERCRGWPLIRVAGWDG